MGFRLLPMIAGAKKIHKMQSVLTRNHSDVPKGHFTVYVGDTEKKRYVVLISNNIPESSFFPEVVTEIRRRVWISSSDGWFNNTLQ